MALYVEGGGKPTDPRRFLLWSRWCRSPAGSSRLLLVQSNRLAWRENVGWFRFYVELTWASSSASLGSLPATWNWCLGVPWILWLHNECSMLNLMPGLLDMLLQFDQKTVAGVEVSEDLILLSLKPGQLFYQLKYWQFFTIDQNFELAWILGNLRVQPY